MRKIYYLLLAALLAPALSFAQPANNDCSGALPIEIDGASVTADNTDATIVGPAGECFFGIPSVGDVWFTFTTTEEGSYRINTMAGTATDSQVAVFSIADCGSGSEVYTEVGCDDDSSPDEILMSQVSLIDLPAGTYYIKCGVYGTNPNTTYTLTLETLDTSAPANDTCAGAIELVVDGDAETANNEFTTISGPDGTCYDTPQVTGDTWFTFTTSEEADIRVLTEGGTVFDSQVAVFTIADCGSGSEVYTEVGCGEDFGFSGMAQIDLMDLPAGTYYIKAGNYGDVIGSYSISLQTLDVTVPVNDLCVDAIELIADGDTLETADNEFATINGPSGSCYGTDQELGETWYTFTTTETLSLRIGTEEGTSSDSQIAVYTIEGCGSGSEVYTEVGCDDDGGAVWMSQVDLVSLPAGTYYVKAGTYGTEPGTYSIWLETIDATVPDNNSCVGATDIVVDGDALPANNEFATMNGPEGTCWFGGQETGDVWFTFTITEDSNIQINTEAGTTTDSQIALFTIDGCDTEDEVYTEVACNDDSGTSLMSTITAVGLPAGTYFIKASNYGTSTGEYMLSVVTMDDIPVNSDCADVVVQSVVVDGAGATVTGNASNAIDNEALGQPHVWEAFTIEECADVTIDLCGTDIEPTNYYLNVVEGCPIDLANLSDAGTGVIAACDGDDIDNLHVTFVGLAPGTYYYPLMSSEAWTVIDDYTLNINAVACAGEPDSCLTYAAGPYNDFNTIFGGAPVPDSEGVCEIYQIQDFESWASESYTIDGFAANTDYTFNICEGPGAGSWSPALSVTDPNGEVVAYVENCSISWTTTIEGTYVIGISEVDACNSSTNTGVNNGYPTLTCEGTSTVGIDDINKVNFSIYPNPGNGLFTIRNAGVSGEYTVDLIDMAGRIVYSQVSALSADSETEVNAQDLVSGVYLVRMINTSDNSFSNQRIVIQ